ncbi:MAG TPA: nuclear transport factor 2 family protein [Acidobacteriaceae bacterium]|nr:nuclear transport factor 2 family protein [Acidobacteriaceae bacterium]
MTDLPMSVAVAFVEAINAADLTALRRLMTNDHTFTDALGNSFSGADPIIAGWQHFLRAYPDYHIQIHHVFSDSIYAALFGRAEGKWRVGENVLPGSWSVAAAWLAEVEEGRVKKWRVFCDTSWASPPVLESPPGR